MTRIFIPTDSLDDWRRLLADPEQQWQEGRTAKRLAQAWIDADGFPPAVSRVLRLSGPEIFRNIDILLAVPEHQVPLPGGGSASSNDLFVLAKSRGQLTTFMIAGKADETFDPTVSEWLQDAAEGKKKRRADICSTIGVKEDQVADMPYRLLHQTAAAVLEAERFSAANAVYLVHSFSETDEGSDDFVRFARLYGLVPESNRLHFAGRVNKVRLFVGWIADVRWCRILSSIGRDERPPSFLPNDRSCRQGWSRWTTISRRPERSPSRGTDYLP